MNPDELRELQAPLKARYREDPETAVVTMRASGDIDSPDVVCKVDTGRALVEAGLHEAAGGNGLTACSVAWWAKISPRTRPCPPRPGRPKPAHQLRAASRRRWSRLRWSRWRWPPLR